MECSVITSTAASRKNSIFKNATDSVCQRCKRRHDILHDDIQHNNTQQCNIKHKINHNNTQHNNENTTLSIVSCILLYAECHVLYCYAKYFNAECRVFIVMLSVVMLIVVMLSVVAPCKVSK
jgi:hypothetical protein